jgi:membrane-bound lytic murein transglycosylase B
LRTDLRKFVLTLMGLVSFFCISLALAGEPPSFQNWLADLREEALSKGISPNTLDKTLNNLEPIPRIIELDSNQPEFSRTLTEYLNLVVSESRVQEGREKWRTNRILLEKIAPRYGVQPRFLLALWGIETRYGRLSGKYPVIASLATLAFQGRRSSFFRKELLEALMVVDKGHMTPEAMNGSWAGAIGQFQFMPSSFRRFGVDFDGDGRIDMAQPCADAFASAANYLAKCGWKGGQTWGREVQLPKSFDGKWIGLETHKSLRQWRVLGVQGMMGRKLPTKPNLTASLIQPERPDGRAFLVYHNYKVLLKWNRSQFFGLSVGLLADRLGGN